jgi:hypothetical protein
VNWQVTQPDRVEIDIDRLTFGIEARYGQQQTMRWHTGLMAAM